MASTGVLAGLLDGVEGVLENECIFLEPYVRPVIPAELMVAASTARPGNVSIIDCTSRPLASTKFIR
jgi:hypothetical protein